MLGAMDFGKADHRQPSGAQTVDSDMVEITRVALGALPRGTWSTLTIAILCILPTHKSKDPSEASPGSCTHVYRTGAWGAGA